jgi:hypothetical protein
MARGAISQDFQWLKPGFKKGAGLLVGQTPSLTIFDFQSCLEGRLEITSGETQSAGLVRLHLEGIPRRTAKGDKSCGWGISRPNRADG